MERYAYFEGRVVPQGEAKISVQTHGFMYGTAVFEGIRAYWVEEEQELLVFRMREHYQRLLNSCRILRIKSPHTVDDLCEITLDILAKTGDRQDAYVRPIFYKNSTSIGPELGRIPDEFVVFSVPLGEYLDLAKGLKVRVSSWRRVSENALPARAKVNGAYVNAALAKTEAVDDGYDEAILLTEEGHVSEGSAENIFIVRDGVLITPPRTDEILEGITRATVIELGRDVLGLEVQERSIDRTELYVADEAFFVGTGAQVSPICEVDRRPVGEGKIGPISAQVQSLYFQVVRGQVEAYRHWCTPVYARLGSRQR